MQLNEETFYVMKIMQNIKTFFHIVLPRVNNISFLSIKISLNKKTKEIPTLYMTVYVLYGINISPYFLLILMKKRMKKKYKVIKIRSDKKLDRKSE